MSFEFDFDFNHWADLAKQDPAAFFAARQQVINDFIAAAPAHHTQNLVEMQRLIDGTRAEAGTPSKAVRALMGMIGDHLEALQQHLGQLREESLTLATTLETSRR